MYKTKRKEVEGEEKKYSAKIGESKNIIIFK